MTRLIVPLGIAILAACGGGADPDGAPDEPAGLAIVGARLIDGSGGDPIVDSVILVRDGRVEAAGPRNTTEIPEGAEVVDAAGKTVIPGRVDLHAHYGGSLSAAEQALRMQAP